MGSMGLEPTVTRFLLALFIPLSRKAVKSPVPWTLLGHEPENEGFSHVGFLILDYDELA